MTTADPVRRATAAPLAKLDNGSILDELPDAVIVARTDGTIAYCNPAAEELLGWPAGGLAGRPLAVVVPERLLPAHTAGFRRYLATREPRVIGTTVRLPARRADGTEVAVELRIGAMRAGADEVFVASLRDLREREELERQQAITRYLEATSTVALRLGAASAGTPVEATASGVLEALGSVLDLEVGDFWLVDGARLRCVATWQAPGADCEAFLDDTHGRVFASGEGLPGRVWATGEPAWISDIERDGDFPRAGPARDAGLRGAFAFPVAAGDRVLGVMEFFTRTVVEPDADLLGALATVGGALGQAIARTRAEATGQFRAALLASQAEASLDAVVVEGADGALLWWNSRFEELSGFPADALRSRRAGVLLGDAGGLLLEPEVFGNLRDAVRRDPSTRRRVELALGDGRVLDCYTSPLGGRRDGTAYGRAWYFRDSTELKRAEERFAGLARTLQASLLPPGSPRVPGLDVAARYRAGAEGMDVGGDFYDVFPLRAATWGVVIGDVCGKGAPAAALTALARYTIRAAAVRSRKPSRVLAALNEAVLLDDHASDFLTVVAGWVRPGPRGTDIHISVGGHPLPRLVRANGTVQAAGRPGTLVGAFADPDFEDAHVSLAPGDAFVLYTDGVTEADRGGELLDESGLDAALAGVAGAGADAIAEAVLGAALEWSGGALRDDVAIVVLRHPG